jgi:RNA polymerase sigma-70 factor (ECF subfamily)
MARNICLNRLRTRNRTAPIDALAEDQHPSSEQNERSRMEELILMALERIPLEQREVLILNVYSGYTFEEIAEMTGESSGTVRTRAWRARRQLKRVITGLIALDDFNEDN